ncbi:MAG: hypothetical protein HY717_16660 [Planctomycetes bacterium]|nr:hypothetical protein [Planctomycetota bacterium]
MNSGGPEVQAAAWQWSLPLEWSAPGGAPAGGERPIEETARLILEVAPGERRLLPDFGWRGHQLERLETPVERAAAAIWAEEALERWAPHLGVERIEILEASADEVLLELQRRGSRHPVKIRRWKTGRTS